FDHVGPLARTVDECEAILAALAPGFVPTRLDSLEQVRVAAAWIDTAEPLVAERVRGAVTHFPDRRTTELRYPHETYELFMREVADVHRELYSEHGDLYSDEVAAKIERCLEVSDAEVAAAARARETYREEAAELLAEIDLLVTPTLRRVAPPAGIGDAALR